MRAEAAARNVVPMTDTLVAGGTPDRSRTAGADDYLPPVRAMHVYRLHRGDDEHIGLVADVDVAGFADGRVRGHEAVSPARVEGLVEHFAAVPRRSELVALLHDGGDEVDRLVAATTNDAPLVDFTGPDGWRQTVWRVPDDVEPQVAEALERSGHYIADGHHRVAASLALWERAGRPPDAALLCVLHPSGGLRLRAFRRRVSGPVDPGRLRTLLATCCEVVDTPSGGPTPDAIGVYVDSTWLAARLTADRPVGVDGLDVTLLESHVLRPMLDAAGADEIESVPVTTPVDALTAQCDDEIESVPVTTPVDALTAQCDDDGGALFVLPPPSLQQLRAVADLGQVMPPKTTYFEPKPYAGVFVR